MQQAMVANLEFMHQFLTTLKARDLRPAADLDVTGFSSVCLVEVAQSQKVRESCDEELAKGMRKGRESQAQNRLLHFPP